MSHDKILNEYLNKGISALPEMITAAKQEIEDIEVKMSKLDKFVLRRSNLKGFLRVVGDPSVNGARDKIIIETEFDTESAKKIQRSILEAFSKNWNSGNKTITNHDLLKTLDGYKIEAIIFSNLQYLGSKKILRNESGILMPGDNWDNRISLVS
jgi:hypothetical protein